MDFPYSVKEILQIASVILGVLLVFSLVRREKSEGEKEVLFWTMTIVIVFTTFFLALDTITKNQSSVTRGPVHWHADFEIYNCGKTVDLKNPKGLSNRIGDPVLHEHGDNRIHVEGVVNEYADVGLNKFFETIGGNLTNTRLTLPTNAGSVTMENDQPCDGQPGVLQVFRYKTEGKTVTQEKLPDPANYILSGYSPVPPGDCLIFEFGPVKDKTDRLCNFYKIAIEKSELKLQE